MMTIQEFQEWALLKGFINPVVEDEKVLVVSRKPIKILTHETRKSGNTLHTFVAVSGKVITVLCDKTGIIKRVSEAEGEVPFLI